MSRSSDASHSAHGEDDAGSAASPLQAALQYLSALQHESHGTVARPQDHSDRLDAEGKYLLTLSRVLTGQDTCAAIYKSEQRHYLVSNNTGDNRHIPDVPEEVKHATEARLEQEIRVHQGKNPGTTSMISDAPKALPRLLPLTTNVSGDTADRIRGRGFGDRGGRGSGPYHRPYGRGCGAGGGGYGRGE